MGTMGYCRFQNTLEDLYNCQEHMGDEVGQDERRARKRLIKLCKDIVDNFGDELDEEDEEN